MTTKGDCMNLELSRKEKEDLLERVANAAFENILNKQDVVDIMEICLNACKREAAKIEEEIGPAYSVIQ